VRAVRLDIGRPADADLSGGILTRDLVVGGSRWAKGRRLSAADLGALAAARPDSDGLPAEVTVLLLEPGDLHEDEAAVLLAAAVAGPGLTVRGPAQSRLDLLAATDGVLHVRTAALERLDRIDPLEVFTGFDGSIVRAGDLVASVKIAPHTIQAAVLEQAVRGLRGGRSAIIRVDPFLNLRVAVLVKESLRAADRGRFETSVRDKVEGLGSTLVEIAYVDDDDTAVAAALKRLTKGRERADVVLTAGGRSTDPLDPFFAAIDGLDGAVVRRGVPAHPGSMLWLGRVGRTGILGLPTCGAYSKATAADLVLPRLLTGERPGPALVAGLGHGGLLSRDQRFRFPAYARDLDAPER
jgi:molybdenum cofactor cytidylyltransferase